MCRGPHRLPRLGLLLFCLLLISSHEALFILASVTNEAPPHAAKSGRAPLSTANKGSTAMAPIYNSNRRALKIAPSVGRLCR
jgi:hypothetical protein